MKKLLVYLKDYKKESVLGPLFKLLEATFELIVPLVMAAIIDTGVATGDKSYIMKMCMVLVLLAVIGLTCSITAQYFAAKAAVGFATKLRHALFAHIESLSFTEMDTVGTATLITRMTSDVNQVQNGVNLVLRLFLRSPFIVFGAMVMAFTIDVKAALVEDYAGMWCWHCPIGLVATDAIARMYPDDVKIVRNPDYAAGVLSSIRLRTAAIPAAAARPAAPSVRPTSPRPRSTWARRMSTAV